MGNCNNLGENSAYILKEQNKECPNNFEQIFNGKNSENEDKLTGSWFSGNSLVNSGKTEFFFEKVAHVSLIQWLCQNSNLTIHANFFMP